VAALQPPTAIHPSPLPTDYRNLPRGLRWAGMIDSQKLKTQTSYALKLHDVRKAAAAYELMHSAAAMLQMLPLPVLEALRDYVQEEVKDRKGPLPAHLAARVFCSAPAAVLTPPTRRTIDADHLL